MGTITARVAVHGELDPIDKLVFDFLELKRIMRRLCGEIDHLVLLPLERARIHVAKDAEVVRVSVDGQPRYVFPLSDCALLPVPNTTVEMLAELLAKRLHAELNTLGAQGLTLIEMEIEESFGQSATCRMPLG